MSCAHRPADVRGRPDAEWTLLVYMASDDDLEQAALQNVHEMAQIGSSGPVNVLVQIDRAAGTRNGRGFTRAPLLNLADFSSTKRLRIDHGAVTELADLGETNTGSAEPLAAFIAWGLTHFPAKKTALVLWDHGGATRGFGWDLTNDDQPLSIVDMHRGIAQGLAAAGRSRLDVLGFDACLMGNLAVAYELRDVTELFVGSEEVEPAHGWAYAPLVRSMSENASPREAAQRIVQSYEAACREQKTIDFCTMAVVDARQLDALVGSLDALGAELGDRTKVAADWYSVARARVSAEEYGAEAGERSPFSTVDLADFSAGAVRALGEPNDVATRLAAATVASFHGPGRPQAHGLSVTFPRHRSDAKAVDRTLQLSQRPGWQGFLDGYVTFADADRTPPTITGLSAVSSADFVEASSTISTEDVAETAGLVGVADASGTISVLSIDVLGRGQSSFRWDKRLPSIRDDRNELPITVFEQPPYRDESGDMVQIAALAGFLEPHGVTAQRIDVVVYVKLAPHRAPSIVGAYRFEDGGRAGEVVIHPDDRFAPMVKTIARDGKRSWRPSSKTVAFGDRARVLLEERPAAPGDYVMGFRVTDYAANRHQELTHVTIP